MTYAASFSVLVADDYSHGNGVGVFHVSFWEYLKASFIYSRRQFLEWQGSYFSMFIQALLSPINNYGFRQLRCVMSANALLFFTSVFLLSWKTLNLYNVKNVSVKLVIIAIVIFCFCGFQSYPQIFFWYSGATSYSLPLSILFIALTMIGDLTKRKRL